MTRLPIKEQGMGLQSLVETIPAAFLGSVEMLLPFLTGEGGQCGLLEPVLGDIRKEEDETRWRRLMQSDCRTATELARC